MTVKIDYLSFTVFAGEEYRLSFWKKHFSRSLGVLIPKHHGGRGFRFIDKAFLDATVYYSPVGSTRDYFHIELKGKSCSCLLPSVYLFVFRWLKLDGIEYKITRLDLAFDAVEGLENNLFFTPRDFYERLLSGNVRSFSRRSSVRYHEAPYEKRENGIVGTSGVYVGSRQSDRLVRVYDYHGFVRLELQLKNTRSHVVGLQLFSSEYSDWEIIAKSHLKQFIDFSGWFEWDYFIGSVSRSDLKIFSSSRLSLSRSKKYVEEQVATTLSVLHDVMGHDLFLEYLGIIMSDARSRGRDKYQSILNLSDSFDKDI